MQHERRGGIDPQAPGGCLLAQGEALFQRLHLFEDVPGVFQEERAFLGQLHPPRGAVEQGGGELFLQFRQGAADRRGGEAELVGGGGDGAAVDDGDEGAQFFGSCFHLLRLLNESLQV
ncbi:hypothetical protein D9M71_492840 [compost metagenome]